MGSHSTTSSKRDTQTFARLKALFLMIVVACLLVSRSLNLIGRPANSSNTTCLDINEPLIIEGEYVDVSPAKSEHAATGYYNSRGDFVAY